MDILNFILRYTPFWAVPLMFICTQFGYTYWLKSIRRVTYICMTVFSICGLFLIFYFWMGGHDGVVRWTTKYMHLNY